MSGSLYSVVACAARSPDQEAALGECGSPISATVARRQRKRRAWKAAMASSQLRREVLLMHRAVPALAPRHPVLCLEKLVPADSGPQSDQVETLLKELVCCVTQLASSDLPRESDVTAPAATLARSPAGEARAEVAIGRRRMMREPLVCMDRLPHVADESAVNTAPEGLDREETLRAIAMHISACEKKAGIDFQCVLRDLTNLLCRSWDRGSFIDASTVKKLIEVATSQCILVFEGRDTSFALSDASTQPCAPEQLPVSALCVASGCCRGDTVLEETAIATSNAGPLGMAKPKEQRQEQLMGLSTFAADAPSLCTRGAQWPYFFNVGDLRCLSEAGRTQRTAVLDLIAELQDVEIEYLERQFWDG